MMMMSGFNGTSTHEGHLNQNGIFIWLSIKKAVMVSHRGHDLETTHTGYDVEATLA